MNYDPDDVSDEQFARSEQAKVPARIKACRAALVAAIAAAEARGVPVRRSEYTVEWSDAGPVSCSPLGAVVLDVPPKHHETELTRLLGITEEERWAIEAGFAGWDPNDYDPRWCEMGQSFAHDLGLECPEVAWPEVREQERREDTLSRAERMRR